MSQLFITKSKGSRVFFQMRSGSGSFVPTLTRRVYTEGSKDESPAHKLSWTRRTEGPDIPLTHKNTRAKQRNYKVTSQMYGRMYRM